MKTLTRVRADFRLIETCVGYKSKVLDLGCSDGALLGYLREQKSITARGIERDLDKVQQCFAKKLSVYHGDLEEGLSFFPEGYFDSVVLSRTIHQIWNLPTILEASFRVGRQVVVVFMNYSYYRNRIQFFFKGINPKSAALPHEWYATPNIRLLSVNDFEMFCGRHSIQVVKRFFYKHNWHRPCRFAPNLFAECAIYLLEKSRGKNLA